MKRLWGWYRKRGWPARIALGLGAAVWAASLAYVAGRSLLYLAAEKEAGVFQPGGAQVTVRLHALAEHWARIQETPAWRIVRRRIFKDPAARRQLNALLRSFDLPTLDDLEDERRAGLLTEANLFRAAGRDLLAALRVGAAWSQAKFCVATRLRFGDYLLVPFARFVLPTENVDGRTVLRVRRGKDTIYVALEGAVAVVSNDRPLLSQALLRRGRRGAPARPVQGRIEIRDSPALVDLVRSLQESGAFPYLRLEELAAIGFTADVAGPAALFDAELEGGRPAADEPPSARLREFLPAEASGILIANAGTEDLVGAVMRTLARTKVLRKPEDGTQFMASFLPYVGREFLLVTGGVEEGGRIFPGAALVVPGSRPREAVEAIAKVVQRIAGAQYDRHRKMLPEGDFEIHYWDWPEGLRINDFLRPCYVAMRDALVFGNNLEFVRTVVRTGDGQAGPLSEQAHYRAVLRRFRDYRLAAEPSPAGLLLFVPALRDSLDGILPRAAEQIVYATTNTAALRAEVDEEFRRQNRAPNAKETVDRFNEKLAGLALDREEALRESLRFLDCLGWLAVQSAEAPRGSSLRLVVEFR